MKIIILDIKNMLLQFCFLCEYNFFSLYILRLFETTNCLCAILGRKAWKAGNQLQTILYTWKHIIPPPDKIIARLLDGM